MHDDFLFIKRALTNCIAERQHIIHPDFVFDDQVLPASGGMELGSAEIEGEARGRTMVFPTGDTSIGHKDIAVASAHVVL